MTQYTKKDLDKEARLIARDIRKETGYPASVHHWILYLEGNQASLAVIVNTYDGKRQRNVAI